MKFVNEFEGYTHHTPATPFGATKSQLLSVPRAHALHPSDTIPTEGLDAIQDVIRTCFPAFADRPVFDTALCWCTDSFDGNWLLTEDPRYEGVVLATGDSGHTFKMLPIVGRYVADLIEGKVSPPNNRSLMNSCPRRTRSCGAGGLSSIPERQVERDRSHAISQTYQAGDMTSEGPIRATAVTG